MILKASVRGYCREWLFPTALSSSRLRHGTLNPRTSVRIRVAPFPRIHTAITIKVQYQWILIISTDVRAVKEYDSSSYGAILVGSNPTLCIPKRRKIKLNTCPPPEYSGEEQNRDVRVVKERDLRSLGRQKSAWVRSPLPVLPIWSSG